MPKYLKLEMFPPSSTTIPAFSTGSVTQEIKVVNTMQGQKNIMLKLKIGYTKGGVAVCRENPLDRNALLFNVTCFCRWMT